MLYCDVAVANPEALDTLAVAVFHLRRAGIEAAVKAIIKTGALQTV